MSPLHLAYTSKPTENTAPFSLKYCSYPIVILTAEKYESYELLNSFWNILMLQEKSKNYISLFQANLKTCLCRAEYADLTRNGERRKPMNAKSKVTLVLMVLVMVWPFLASAQDTPADNMQLVVEKIRADKKLLIAQNMQLTEAEAKAFWPVYERYQDELFLLRARTRTLINGYAEAYEEMTNDTAKNLLDEYMTIEALGLKVRQTYLPKFRKVVPDVKVVRYYQIENKINAALIYELAAKIPLIKSAK